MTQLPKSIDNTIGLLANVVGAFSQLVYAADTENEGLFAASLEDLKRHADEAVMFEKLEDLKQAASDLKLLSNHRPDVDETPLKDAINRVWCARFPGPAVEEPSQLVLRVEKLAEDRDCWLANAKANQQEYIRLEKRLKEAEVVS